MAGGEAGVSRSIEILTQEFARTMKLIGVTRVSDLTADLVTLP
jgi:L-lactate dehydrogenase (cytochrome)